MRKRFLFIALVATFEAVAQDPFGISDLKAPSSPAFTILGVQPNEVTRPKSYNDLEVAIMNNFLSDGKFVLPNNYALEFSPYWIFKHQNLTFDQYVNPDRGQFFLRSLAFSIATNDRKDIIDSTKTVKQLSFGGRFQIRLGSEANSLDRQAEIQSFLNTNLKRLIIQQHITNLLGVIINLCNTAPHIANFVASTNQVEFVQNILISEIQNQASAFISNPANGISQETSELVIDDLKELIRNVDNSVIAADLHTTLFNIFGNAATIMNTPEFKEYVKKDISDKLKEFNTELYGSFLEIASAGTLEFPDRENTNFSKTGKVSLWLTYTYRTRQIKQNQGEFIGMVRETYDLIQPLKTSNLDVGARLLYQYKKRFSVSAEMLGRYKTTFDTCTDANGKQFDCSDSKTDWRFFFSVEYRLKDNLSLNYGIGRDFDNNYVSSGNLLSLLGLNFGFGGAKVAN